MIRKALTGLLGVAALGTLVLGVVSFWKGIPEDALWINWFIEEPRIQFAMVRGTLHAVYSVPLDSSRPPKYETAYAGFYLKSTTVGRTLARGAGAPFWSLFVVLAIPPSVALVRGPWRRRRRRRRGSCVKCGYNLTGLPEPRCPECGQSFAPTSCLDAASCSAAQPPG